HWFGSGCLCPVDFSDLPDEDAQGMAVTHDLVRDEENDVPVRVELEDRGGGQRAPFQAGGGAPLVDEKLLDVTRVGTTSRIRDVDDRDTDRKRRRDHWHRPTVLRSERCAQPSVAGHDRIERLLQEAQLAPPQEYDAQDAVLR